MKLLVLILILAVSAHGLPLLGHLLAHKLSEHFGKKPQPARPVSMVLRPVKVTQIGSQQIQNINAAYGAGDRGGLEQHQMQIAQVSNQVGHEAYLGGTGSHEMYNQQGQYVQLSNQEQMNRQQFGLGNHHHHEEDYGGHLQMNNHQGQQFHQSPLMLSGHQHAQQYQNMHSGHNQQFQQLGNQMPQTNQGADAHSSHEHEMSLKMVQSSNVGHHSSMMSVSSSSGNQAMKQRMVKRTVHKSGDDDDNDERCEA